MVVVRDYIFLPVIVILFLVTLYFVNVRPLQANRKLIAALTACSSNGAPKADLFACSSQYNQYVANQEIREQLLNCSSNVIASGLATETKTAFYNLTLQKLQSRLQQLQTMPEY
jgi:hypothetical protein